MNSTYYLTKKLKHLLSRDSVTSKKENCHLGTNHTRPTKVFQRSLVDEELFAETLYTVSNLFLTPSLPPPLPNYTPLIMMITLIR